VGSAALLAHALTLAGSSALLRSKRGAGRAIILDLMGKYEDGVFIWTV
jgi:hypothetical protein